jgi:hypothetical protein
VCNTAMPKRVVAIICNVVGFMKSLECSNR